MCGSKSSAPVYQDKENTVEFGPKIMQTSDGVKFFEIHVQTIVTGGVAILVMIALMCCTIAVWRCWLHKLVTIYGGGSQEQGRGYVAEYRNDEEERDEREVRRERRLPRDSPILPKDSPAQRGEAADR